MIKTCCLLVTLLGFSLVTNAQQKQGAWWMFGDSLRINFNNQPLKADTGGLNKAPHYWISADATISDANGGLLFFTNGLDVRNRKKKVMPNGILNPWSFNNRSISVMIVPVPNNPYEYFIFNVFGNVQFMQQFSLEYSKVDLRLNNGLGDVVPGTKNIKIKSTVSKYLTVLLQANNRDFWLVSANKTFDTLFTYPVTPNGIGSPLASSIPFLPSIQTGNMKSSPNSEWIVAPSFFGTDELFKFNRSTGEINHFATLSPIIPGPESSVAFSTDNTKLYLAGKHLYQFDLQGSSPSSIQNSRILIDSLEKISIIDLQLGIDGKLYASSVNYAAVPAASGLSIIHCPNMGGLSCRFEKMSIDLYNRRPGGMLPTLNQTLFRNTDKLQALAMRDTICLGDSVQLSAFGAAADHFRWFPSGVADTIASPFVKPLQTTTYTVIGFSACRQDTAQVTVMVLTDENTKPNLLAVSVDTVDETRINMSYNVNAANSLSLEQKTSNGWQVITALSPQSTANTEAGLNTQEQSYYYRLRSLNHCNSEVWSETHTTVLLQAADQQKEKVTLKWSAYKGWGTEPVTYQVWQKTENEPTYQLIPTLTTTDTTAIATIASIGFKPCFRVKAIGSRQQSWSNSVCLEVANLPEFYNIITPNDDGLNDSFSIKNLNLYPQSKLQIYNRWGQQVFNNDNYQNNWQGEGESSGIYFYRFTTAGGQSYKGWVEVVR